ncbi:unnamed protein product [Brassica rapa]|uniref:Uncharacterized protein n=1 Tax=Brassica campestris TaxID=3711 RepID=A0A8D9GXY2_BRACM|nr:unnamed protein product [Brassica rapa]
MMWPIYWRASGFGLENGSIFTLGKVLFRFFALYINSKYTLNSPQCFFFVLSQYLIFEKMVFDIYFFFLNTLIFTFVYRKKV